MLLKHVGVKRFVQHFLGDHLWHNGRYLYTAASLGMDEYVEARKKIEPQFNLIGEKYKQKMHEFSDPSAAIGMVFTEDLKQVTHLVDGSESDMQLIHKMIRKFKSQDEQLRFGSFVFGPVVMRMYYFLNKPIEALEVYNDKSTEGFFDQLTTHIILLDLLFNNGLYSEMLEVYKNLREKQMLVGKHPRGVITLVMAACYKINTPIIFKYVQELWTEMKESGHSFMDRTVYFAAALALKQNNPYAALEMTYVLPKQGHVTTKSIQAKALAYLNRIDEALNVLRSILDVDEPYQQKQKICVDVLDSIRRVVEAEKKKDNLMYFKRVEKQLNEQDYVDSQSLDDYLCSEINHTIVVKPSPYNKDRLMKNAFLKQSGNVKVVRRPGLHEMV